MHKNTSNKKPCGKCKILFRALEVVLRQQCQCNIQSMAFITTKYGKYIKQNERSVPLIEQHTDKAYFSDYFVTALSLFQFCA